MRDDIRLKGKQILFASILVTIFIDTLAPGQHLSLCFMLNSGRFEYSNHSILKKIPLLRTRI